MNELTLVVMAAGMGSRFGGLKQITPVDEDGNFLIDYSVYDAIKAGFQKVVFIIKEENIEAFKETIGARLESKIKVEYAYQKLEDIPSWVTVPKNRMKPWGTVHAILAARKNINGPFAVINADDFYGFDSYDIVAKFLNNVKEENTHISIPYPFCHVDSKYGFVKRGVLSFHEDEITEIVECNVGYENGKVIAKPLDGRAEFEIKKDHPVSMNMFGFQAKILQDFDAYFTDFLKKNQNNLETAESLISEFLEKSLNENRLKLKYQTSKGEWLGMTYKEDLEEVKEKLNTLKVQGEYNEHLW
ncbi:MAG: NTP transferase domain-containing protein [Bacilli bacterium]|nr:NTP transferase domain-containing protein [Bacilli bacterium]